MTTTTDRPLETGHLDDTPVGDTLLRRFLHNQAEHNALLATAGGGQVRRPPGAVLTRFATPVPYLNQAVLLRPLAGADDPLVGEAAGFLAETGGTLLSAWPTPDLGSGWQLMGHPTFVVRPAQPAAEPTGRAAATPATTPDDLALVERLAAEGYPMPELVGAPAGAAYPQGVLGDDRLRLVLGTLDGRPVGAAACFVAHDVVNLCLAATLPQARRQGVWEAMAQARLAGAPGVPAAAFTSDYSRAGFEKLGFLPVTRFAMWLRTR